MFKIHKFLTLYNSVFFYLYHLLKILLIPYLKIEKIVPKKGLIIDLGCSYGLLTNILAYFNKNRKLIGLDYNKNRIKKAFVGLKNTEYKAKDISKVSIPKVDCILLVHVLHHVDSRRKQISIINECKKKLKKNGKLIISEINMEPAWKFAISKLADKVLYPNDKCNYLGKKLLFKILKKKGFKIITSKNDERSVWSDFILTSQKN